MEDLLQNSYVFSASPGQERLWFLNQFDEKLGGAYNIAIAFKINSAINRVALQKAANYLVARHESLRTALVKTDGMVKQCIIPSLLTTINYFDYQTYLGQNKLAAIQQAIKNEASHFFDLAKPGLLRLSLYQAEDNGYYFSITMHHSIADGLSLEIFILEIFESYAAFINNQEPQFPVLQYQYADIVEWSANWKNSAEYFQHQEHWQKKLANASQSIKLKGAQKVLNERTYLGSIQQYKLEQSIIDKVDVLSSQFNTSNYTVLIAAFCLLIHNYSNADDFLIGVPVANRHNENMQNIMGFLANTLLLRVKINKNDTISDFIKNILCSINEYVNFQRYPYNEVVNYLQPKRQVNSNSLFQIMFGYQIINSNYSLKSGLPLERMEVDIGLSKFDLAFFIFEENENISIITEYSLEIFSEAWMTSFIHDYKTILSLLFEKLNQAIGVVNFLPRLNHHEDNKVHKTELAMPISTVDSTFSPVSSLTEKRVEKIWQTLLEIDKPISINDNFFELGGNSLMVTRLIELFALEIGIILPIKAIFLGPTIKQLAENLDQINSTKHVKTEMNSATLEELTPILMELT
jgi:hypothetical protein